MGMNERLRSRTLLSDIEARAVLVAALRVHAGEERASQRVFGLMGRHFAELAPAAHTELTVTAAD
jgi:hypothetical protein